MTSGMKHHDIDCDLTHEHESRTSTSSSTPATLEQKFQGCSLNDILEKDDLCNGNTGNNQDDKCTVQERYRARVRLNSDGKPRSPPPAAAMNKRPGLQKKSYSDLVSYRNVHMKILVEGKEVLDTRLQDSYCLSNGGSPQEQSTDKDARTLQEQEETKKPGKLLAGWFAKKTQSKSQNSDKDKEPPIGFRSLKRSKSFSGRIKDKIKSISPSSSSYTVGSPPKSNYLQPPLFYKIIEIQNFNYREDNAFRGNYQRRHSDQTDSMSRRPLGAARYDLKSKKYYTMSLERGLKQRTESDKRPLVRKKSNSLETPFEFPFWSQITDADRSISCNARIRVSETRREADGTLETNLCSTEL